MKKTKLNAYIIIAFLMASCAAIQPGNDPVIVNAERLIAVASDTFDVSFQAEYQNHALLKQQAPQVVSYVNYVRTNAPAWLASAQTALAQYEQSKTSSNQTALQAALAILQAADAQLNIYFPSTAPVAVPATSTTTTTTVSH